MKGWMGTLRARLLLSHLAIVVISIAVLVVAGRQLGSAFVDDHLRSMGQMMSGMGAGNAGRLEEGIDAAFNRALLWAALLGAVAALAAAGYGAARLLRPLDEVRRVARRLASGSYGERVAAPREEELAALAGDVNALAEALEETEQRRLRLISEVAHELRTPVATLKGYLEGLLDGVFQPDPETLAASIHEARRLERLAEDLSALSRAEEGRVELRLGPADLAELATEVAGRLRPQFEDQQVELTAEPGPTLPVTVDRDRITQVLTNLIGNALSYTPTGGRVTVNATRSGDTAQVTVTDTGRGLTAEQTHLVFDRFYRADRSTRGTGIGLTIARSLARLHGGDVTASSPGPDQGSTFLLTVPLTSRS
jgi:histidine kinase